MRKRYKVGDIVLLKSWSHPYCIEKYLGDGMYKVRECDSGLTGEQPVQNIIRKVVKKRMRK